MNAIPYGRQKIEEEDIEAVSKVLRSDFLTQGPAVIEFEKSFSNYLLSKTSEPNQKILCSAVNNATSALHLACLSLGVEKGSKVLVTANSFVASANCVLYCGGEVEFIDTDARSQCIDLQALDEKLKKHPKGTFKGIVAVDYAGYPLDAERLRSIADQYGLWVIEDACHAPGACRKDSSGKTYAAGDGKYADISIFSFHPVKHIAAGEGGMLVTRSASLDQKIKLLRSHGITKDPTQMSRYDGGWSYEMIELGYNMRISDILCSLASSQLKRMPQNLAARQKIAQRYFKELKNLPIELPINDLTLDHAFHLFVIQTDKRKELYDHLIANKIFVQVHYIPIHQQPFYINRYGKQMFVNADHFYETCLSLPMYHSLNDEDQGRVISTIKEFFASQPASA